MGLGSVLAFFVVAFGLGAAVLLARRRKDLDVYDLAILPGFGICVFIILAVLFSLLRIPLHWEIFVALGIVGLVAFIFLRRDQILTIRPSKDAATLLIVVILAGAMFSVYLSGAFSYPYLENDDSWGHALSTRYVANEKTLFEPEHTFLNFPESSWGAFQYIDPYPPAYNALMGVFAQLDARISWTLKFFNSLIISLGYVFFFVFARKLMGKTRPAFFATLLLLAMPAYFSHFIWAISLSVPLYFVAFYCIERIRDDWGFVVPATFAVGANLLVSPTHTTYFVLFAAVYGIVRVIFERRIPLLMTGAMVAGASIAALFWWVPMLMRYGNFSTFIGYVGLSGGSLFGVAGTGDRSYNIADFAIVQNQNMINAPVGLGLAVVGLAFVGTVLLLIRPKKLFSKGGEWKLLALFWLALAVYAVNSASMPIHLSAFRTWMLLAIPVALVGGYAWEWFAERKGSEFWIVVTGVFISFIAYESYALSVNGKLGFSSLPVLDFALGLIIIPLLFAIGWGGSQLLRRVGVHLRRIPIIIFLVIGVFVLVTSFMPKYEVNTVPWHFGGNFFSEEEFKGFMTLKQLEPGTRVFSLTARHSSNIIGLDADTCVWCEDDMSFRELMGEVDAQTLFDWTREHKYEYIIIDTHFVQVYGINHTNELIQDLVASKEQFRPFSQTQGFVMFQVL